MNIRSTGLLGQRVHVNVDFDTERDYSSNNNVQIYYEGLQDEIVRRMDVGTVVFQPPPSRFITAAVPANNFGVNATFELGPVQLQTLAATQKGSVVAERTYTVGQTTSQAQDRQVRDLDFESGRFFWVVDPASLPGYPGARHPQARTRRALAHLPPEPGAGLPLPCRQQQERGEPESGRHHGARPAHGDSPQQFGPVRWELLIQGTDYYLDAVGPLGRRWAPSSTRTTISRSAIGRRRATTIGTFPEVDRGTSRRRRPAGAGHARADRPAAAGARPARRSATRCGRCTAWPAPTSTPPRSRWASRSTASERPLDGNGGDLLATAGARGAERRDGVRPGQPSLPALAGSRRRPGRPRLLHRLSAPPAVRRSRPASRPPRRPTRCTERRCSCSSSQGPPAKFAVRLHYNATGGGDRSTLNLNALQLREDSEQLFVGGRKLVRGVDYSISYDVGQVTFLNPDALFGQGSAQVTARFEEQRPLRRGARRTSSASPPATRSAIAAPST